MIAFDKNECNSIKSIIVKRVKGEMLMFAKLSTKSFVYDMIDIFCFPDENIQAI